jgi:putative transposase
MPSPTHSTLDQEKLSDGELQPRRSMSTYYRFNKRVLLPPVEPSQFTAWAFTNRIRQAGLMPSFGSVGDGLDNAIDENPSGQACKSSYSTVSEKKTRIELANAIFEYIEIFHNQQRRHSGLAYRTPIEFELAYENPSIPA